jgi:hypothetical protein
MSEQQSVFDNDVLGKIETAESMSDLFDSPKEINVNNYEGNYYYFCCANIHPSLTLFIPCVSKTLVDSELKKWRDKINSVDEAEKDEAVSHGFSSLIETSNTFKKYSAKGGARQLEKYAKQGHQEYKKFCNDVALYYIITNVFFKKGFQLWDIEQIKQMGYYRG